MPKKKMNEFEKMKDAAFGGALALQSTQLLSRPRTTANLSGTIEGFVGIGVAGAVANQSFNMVKASQPYKKKKRKRR